MEYTVGQLAGLSGVSRRTLRYYDEIGLLSPRRQRDNNYRTYGPAEVDRLQEILFFRELGLPLEQIARMLSDPEFDRQQALTQYLAQLHSRRDRLTALIASVQKTIDCQKGGIPMSDPEKFEVFRDRLIQENEARYGEESRASYGEEAVEASREKFRGLTETQYREMEALGKEILAKLEEAVRAGESPEGPAGQEIAALHKRWLSFTWPSYSKEAHAGLGQLYLDDGRFTAYYDREEPGCARFLRDAILAYVK